MNWYTALLFLAGAAVLRWAWKTWQSAEQDRRDLEVIHEAALREDRKRHELLAGVIQFEPRKRKIS
jgi:hypothetical protein